MTNQAPEPKRFTPRPNSPVSDAERAFWNKSTKQLIDLHNLIEAVRTKAPEFDALDALVHRISGTINSIWVLRRSSLLDWGFDGMILLRGIYDAHIQARWILADPSKVEERALLYLDWKWVERHNMLPVLDASPTSLAKLVAKSPKRKVSEPYMAQQFARVRSKYERKPGGKLRTDWSGIKIKDMATELGADTLDEFVILYRSLSGVVHSSALAIEDQNPMFGSEFHPIIAWKFQMRVLARHAELHGVELTGELPEVVDYARANIFNTPKPPRPKIAQP